MQNNMEIINKTRLKITWLLKSGLLKIWGYRPELFWNIWSMNFDKEEPQVIMHSFNVKTLELIKDSNPKSILEVGCGFGRNLKYFIDNGFNPNNIAGVDISRLMLLKARKYICNNKDVKLIYGDVTKKLPFDDNSYDLVFVAAVLMHVPGELVKKSISEAYRVAKRKVIFMEQCDENIPANIKTKSAEGKPGLYTFLHNYKLYMNELQLKIEEFYFCDEVCIFSVRKNVWD